MLLFSLLLEPGLRQAMSPGATATWADLKKGIIIPVNTFESDEILRC